MTIPGTETVPANGGFVPDHHEITITEDRDWAPFVESRFRQPPTLLRHSAGKACCSIFRVPRGLAQINKSAYKPKYVSIGPYHHGRKHLMMVEEHKPRYLHSLISRTQPRTTLNDYFNAIASREEEIRDSYSQPLGFDGSTLIMMMVMDASFVVEIFRRNEELVESDPEDPFFNMIWVFTNFMRDFIYLENQIPFFVLETIYNLSKSPQDPSFYELALKFFNRVLQRPEEELRKDHQLPKVKHLLDLVKWWWLLDGVCGEDKVTDHKGSEHLALIQSAKKLHLSGIKFHRYERGNLLDIRFADGVLRIPPLTIDDFTASFFLNSVAFEECYCYRYRHVTTYVRFLGCLTASEDDAGFLCERRILENYYGTESEVAGFFNDLGKEVGFDVSSCYLGNVFEGVNRYKRNRWHARWTGLRREYFGSPWSFISAAAALTLLVLAFLQTFYTIYGNYVSHH